MNPALHDSHPADTPLPVRNGVGPSCVALPHAGWGTIAEFLVARFGHVAPHVWADRMARGEVVDEHGLAVTALRPFAGGLRVYYYREVPHEAANPAQEHILFQDEHLVVVDKPHGLPVVPSGRYLLETVLIRLKQRLGLATLAPLHRIDRDTAGLVMFAVQVADRAAYQRMFSAHALEKTYEATAPWNPALPWPVRRASRIVRAAHFMQQHEVDGPPNAITDIAPVEVLGKVARYRLKPMNGQRHQLRVHMAALGLPLLGDGIYPVLTPEGAHDPQQPLQLLARSLAFTDPVTGQARAFTSQRQLRSLTEFQT